MKQLSKQHTSVLLGELVAGLNLPSRGVVIDCTVGAGGHTGRVLEVMGSEGLVIGIDRDREALQIAEANLQGAVSEGRLVLHHGTFDQLNEILREIDIGDKGVLGIIADIGVSSMHLDNGDRGFSFMVDAPLDMRMDQSRGLSASEWLRQVEEAELSEVLFRYGEEPKARYIARAIIEQRQTRPVARTLELAELVKRAVRYPSASRKHPATKTFQALRIAVNDELGQLERLLTDAFEILAPGGRLAIISFHSLEDRIVKKKFVQWSGRDKQKQLPRDLPLTAEQLLQFESAKGKIIKPFPTTPSLTEIDANPRSRSAKLRIFEKHKIS